MFRNNVTEHNKMLKAVASRNKARLNLDDREDIRVKYIKNVGFWLNLGNLVFLLFITSCDNYIYHQL